MSEQEQIEIGGPGTDVVPHEDRSPAERPDPATMLQSALDSGTDVEDLGKLMDLYERWENRQAERALNRALAAFQAECPAIPRTGTAEVKKSGTVQYEYHFAPLDKIIEVIRPHLQAHGLSYTHDSRITEQGGVEMTCTLMHVDGATKTATFRGPLDKSGGKNAIQEVASARSYGRRYSLVDVLGLATEDDDDGHGTGHTDSGELVTEQQASEIKAGLKETDADVARFLAHFGIEAVDQLPRARYGDASAIIEQKRARQKARDSAA